METPAQEIFGEYYGKPVNPTLVAEEIQALVMGHAAGTLNAAQQRLYAALANAGQIVSDPP
jgi:hypothetical protein